MENYTTTVKQNQTLKWSWESGLPLECTSHFVRIRSLMDDAKLVWNEWSSWTEATVLPSSARKPFSFYPQDKVVEEGSNVTLCYFAKRNQERKCYFNNTKEIYGEQLELNVTVFHLNHVPISERTGFNVECKSSDKEENKSYPGTVVFVVKKIKDFSCETQDFKTLTCTWDAGPEPGVMRAEIESYSLLESISGNKILCQSNQYCNWKITQDSQEMYNFTLLVKYRKSKRSVNLGFNLTHRVHPKAPYDLVFKNVTARHVNIAWKVEPLGKRALLLCQLELVENGSLPMIHNVSVQKDGYYLWQDLKPNTNYSFTIKCAYLNHFWKWSQPVTKNFCTLGAAPSKALDVWRMVESTQGRYNVTLFWKPLSSLDANGKIRFYNLTVQNLDKPSMSYSENLTVQNLDKPSMSYSERIPKTHCKELILNHSSYKIFITAVNNAGSSPASVIGISAEPENNVKEERINGTEKGIFLSWKPQSKDVISYVVDWCGSPQNQTCDLQWMKLHRNTTSTKISSDTLKSGIRYNFRIYGISTQNFAYLLAKKIGYSEELAPIAKPQVLVTELTHHYFTLNWSKYAHDDASQRGFIQGYNVYLKPKNEHCLEGFKKEVCKGDSACCKYIIDNPQKKIFTLENLEPGYYEYTVTSYNSVGESNRSFKEVKIPKEISHMLIYIIVPMIFIFLIMMIVCSLKSEWMKEKCFPDIPDPYKSSVLSLIKYKNPHPTIMNVKDCIPDAIEVINKPEGNKIQCLSSRKSLIETEPQPAYLHILPTAGSCICFENLTYTQTPSGSSCCDHVLVPPKVPPSHLELLTSPEKLQTALKKDYVNSLGETHSGETTLNYVSQLASPISSDKDSVPTNCPLPELCSEYKMQTALSAPTQSENNSVPSNILLDLGEHFR